MMVVELRLPPTPALSGKLFIQKTEQFTIMMTIFDSIFLNEIFSALPLCSPQ